MKPFFFQTALSLTVVAGSLLATSVFMNFNLTSFFLLVTGFVPEFPRHVAARQVARMGWDA
jgi:hypothetical protein